ncbi:MAG: peptidoglycan-associated lipoprotein Pal [Candidatus Acidiferrum sp.]
MIRVSSSLYRGAFFAAVLSLALVAGCRHTPLQAPAPPQQPPPPATKPTVSLQASPTTINKGDSSTLSWTSTDATQLTISPEVGAVTAQGSTKVTPSDSTTYTITASGPGGSADSSARVTVEAPAPPPVQEAPDTGRLFLQEVKDAYFDFNKADIRDDARTALGQTADFLRKYPEIKATIEGHCDDRGSTEYNLVLGDRRAAAVKAYLVSLGISADRLTTVSYGKEKPFCTEDNDECWQKNRVGHLVKAN